MSKKTIVLLDLKHVVVSLRYKHTCEFLERALKDNWSASFENKIDDVKLRGLMYAVGAVAKTLQAHTLREQLMDHIVTSTEGRVSSMIQSLPSVDSKVDHECSDRQFVVNLSFKKLWEEFSNSEYELQLIHISSSYKFKEEAWQRTISQLEQELSTTIPTLHSPGDICSIYQGAKQALLVTARPKLFELAFQSLQVTLSIIYFNSASIKLSYKCVQEKFVNSCNISMKEVSCLSQMQGLLQFIRKEEDQPNIRTYRVGYCFSDQKFALLQEKNRSISPSFPVLYIPVDLRFRLTRKIDMLYHKITDFRKNIRDNESQLKIANFNNIYYRLSKQHLIQFIDPPESLSILANRMSFQCMFAGLIASQKFNYALKDFSRSSNSKRAQFRVPNSKKIRASDKIDIEHMLFAHNMSYPLILKTVVPCASSNSHKMAVAINEEGLRRVEENAVFRKEDHLLQELVNHSGRIYKVYVIGGEIRVLQKQSMPDIDQHSFELSHFFFDSQQSFDQIEAFKDKLGFEEDTLNFGAVQLLCNFIRKELNLSLFGVDIVQETATGVYYLLDINYFPGYKSMDHEYGEILKKHIITTLNTERNTLRPTASS